MRTKIWKRRFLTSAESGLTAAYQIPEKADRLGKINVMRNDVVKQLFDSNNPIMNEQSLKMFLAN